MNAGIYSILCIINNKRYIGSCDNLNRRKIVHFSNLRNNKYTNKLQEDWNLYGEKSFIFEVLEKLEKDDILLSDREWFYMNKYKTFIPMYGDKYGYNINGPQRPNSEIRKKMLKTNSGSNNGMYNKNHSKETRNKQSKIRKERNIAKGENNGMAILSYDDFCKIKKMLYEGNEPFYKKYEKIAPIFNVSTITIKRIKMGKHHFEERWRLENEEEAEI